ncbi:putative disease resistance protein RGA3 [Asparagus officinalis]|uniref:putative disease resistance protein RGA3 n=1 Tax=Asparagus officinalis TaxID=4686 RepID=UPI00098E05DF|nr:putative disease resistance protein RGA3 [Asparagus officinalis]XP_020268736.1 putative disease resistance protein RGA3 [Asparagus officinalis]
MVVVGDVIVTKIIHQLMEIGLAYIKDRYFANDTTMKDELERLGRALPRIEDVVEMAESGQQEITGALKKWLWQLKDVVYEADNVLDELDYLKLQKQVEEKASGSKGHGDRGRGKVRGFLSDSKRKAVKAGKRVFKSDLTLGKLRGAVKRLDEVAAGVGDFISTLQEHRQLHQQHQSLSMVSARETGPALTERKVFGRDEDTKKLLGWLREDVSSTSVSLFSIFGHGGVGKTTLAQLVYNDESLANSFDSKIWVCISTPFDVKKVMVDIIEYVKKKRPEVRGLAALQEALKDLVSSRKFLLVLDDAWNDDNRSEWDKLFAPLRSGHKGSKILLTTRSESAADMATLALGGSIKKSLKLNPLYGEDFLSLFKQHAFAGVDSCDYRKLESIGKQIARRLGGLPLAAKTIGALLNSKLDDSHWTRILQANNISDQAQQRDGVMAVLMLSYHHLPMHLRPCFSYCSIFPQDYVFEKDDLVFMWMALGLIQKSSQYPNETLEDTGRGYFDDLVKLSFLEKLYYKAAYNMHDLLHDLAREVSHGECFRFVGDMSIDQIPNTVRHLHFETDKLDLLKDVGKQKKLRTLVLVFRGYVNEHAKDFEEAFKSLESIRVLRLDVDGMNALPDAIGNLRHIRYLSIRHVISRLPSSFCRLYHLQVLNCFWPPIGYSTGPVLGLNNLVSLRHLIPCEVYYEKIEGIGTLTSLQRLSFAANVYKLSELKEMRDLRELKIRGLENRKHHEEVSTIELHCKKNLLMLELVWSDDSDVADEYELMLDRLQPPDSLRGLTIKGYQGARSPCWMGPELLKNLEYMSLVCGRAWKHLPSLGKLPYLMRLTLGGLPALQQINCEGGFQQLRYLDIYDCEQWEEWCGLEAEAVPWCPLLKELVIEYCRKLKALPPLPLGLQKLELDDVGLSDSPAFWVSSNCGGSSCGTASSSSTSSPSLSELRIRRCGELTSVAGLFRHHLTSLRLLRIEDCPELRMSPNTVTPADCGGPDGLTPKLASIVRLKALPHLYSLTIRECPKLVQAAEETTPASIIKREEEQELTSTVEDLYIDDPFLLRIEPLRNLTSVRWLKIGDCSHLEAALAESWLLQNSTSLQHLELWGKAKFLPSSILQALPSLDYLTLGEAYELQSLPQLPLSLRTLEIRGCNEALKERCRENEGADWPNIRHITYIHIR